MYTEITRGERREEFHTINVVDGFALYVAHKALFTI